MKPILSCAFNMDTACVELRFLDGTMPAIDTIAVEDEVAANMFERSEPDYLIYNDPVGYADLILNRDPEAYLRQVTDYHPLDNSITGTKEQIKNSELIHSHEPTRCSVSCDAGQWDVRLGLICLLCPCRAFHSANSLWPSSLS